MHESSVPARRRHRLCATRLRHLVFASSAHLEDPVPSFDTFVGELPTLSDEEHGCGYILAGVALEWESQGEESNGCDTPLVCSILGVASSAFCGKPLTPRLFVMSHAGYMLLGCADT